MKPKTRQLLKKILEYKPEPNVDRLYTALSRKGTPDRVPFMGLFADGEVVAAILGKPLDYLLGSWEVEENGRNVCFR